MKTRLWFLFTATMIAGPFLASIGLADESPFAYLYTADTLPKGHWEYEQWNTIRAGKAAGSYTAFDLDHEVEHGFTDRFQAAVYLHSSFLHTRNVPQPDDAAVNLANHDAFDINGVSVELKYRILSPYKDPIGLSLYLEPEMGVRERLTGTDISERALECKLILVKNFLEDRLVLASNIVFEPEWQRSDGERSKELANEYDLGAAYLFKPHWSGGLELLNRRNFRNQDFSQQRASAIFLGPMLHYGSTTWWTSLTVLPQIGGTPRALGLDANGNAVADSTRTLAEYEKIQIRLKIGIEF